MKKYIFLLAFVFLHADISEIITEIKKMESYTPVFKNFVKYDVFGSSEKKIKIKKPFVVNGIVKLNAVFQKKANINGIWVKKGDLIGGYTVLKVGEDYVLLRKDKYIKKLSLKPKILKVVK
ncbi:hypothetical protein [Nautilia sp.]